MLFLPNFNHCTGVCSHLLFPAFHNSPPLVFYWLPRCSYDLFDFLVSFLSQFKSYFGRSKLSLNAQGRHSPGSIINAAWFKRLIIVAMNCILCCKDPPSSLQSPLSKIQTKPLYISTEDPATHFWDWAKPNIYNILYSTQMNYWWTYGEDQVVFVAMDE